MAYTQFPAINSYEASASISDPAGNLLFYTDGVNVWNRNGAVMPNVQSVKLQGGIDASQGALIVPKPGSGCNEYYIFTTQSPFTVAHPALRYSIVQMNATTGAGLGDVTSKNVLLQNDVSAQVTATVDGSGGYWVMSHSSGLGGSDLGGPHAPFDASTVYGIEFAPLGKYLYISTYGEARPSPGAYCQLVQVDLQNLSNKNVVATAPVRGVADFGQLQLAPDGAIYMARQGRNYLSKVSNCDAATPVFAAVGKPLHGASAWGLPNMVQGPFSCGCAPNTTVITVNGVVFCCSTSNGSVIDASTTNFCCTKQ